MKTPNLTGPSGKLSSLFKQKTNSSTQGNVGPELFYNYHRVDHACSLISRFLFNESSMIFCFTFFDGSFHHPPDGVSHLTEEGRHSREESVGQKMIQSRTQASG